MRYNRVARTSAGVATVDAYTDVTLYFGSYDEDNASYTNPNAVWTNVNGAPIYVHAWNTGANNIDVKVLASNDRTLADAYWVDLSLSLTAIATTTGKAATIAQPGMAFLKVQAKSSASSTPGTVNVAISQRGFE